MLILNIKSKDGSKCISSGADNDSFGIAINTIDINPNQILYTRVFGRRIIINFSGRWISIANKNWNSLSAEEFYQEKFINALKNNEDIIIE